MPWSVKQNRLFEAAAHDPSVAKRVGIPQDKAYKMASEGVRRSVAPQSVNQAMGHLKKHHK